MQYGTILFHVLLFALSGSDSYQDEFERTVGEEWVPQIQLGSEPDLTDDQAFSSSIDKVYDLSEAREEQLAEARIAQLIPAILHRVEECRSCGKSKSFFCGKDRWAINQPDIENGFTLGDPLTEWGCDKLPEKPILIRDIGSGSIYAVDPHTLHDTGGCNPCGGKVGNVCDKEKWVANIPNVEKAYLMGEDAKEWGCDNVNSELLLVRNSKTKRVYFIESTEKSEAGQTLKDEDSSDTKSDDTQTTPSEPSSSDGENSGKSPKRTSSQYSEDRGEKPKKRSSKDSEDIDERPKKRYSRDSEDSDERPKKRYSRDSEDSDERPKKRSSGDSEDRDTPGDSQDRNIRIKTSTSASSEDSKDSDEAERGKTTANLEIWPDHEMKGIPYPEELRDVAKRAEIVKDGRNSVYKEKMELKKQLKEAVKKDKVIQKKIKREDAKAKKSVLKAAEALKQEVAKAKSGELQTKEEVEAVAKRIKTLEKKVTKKAKQVKFGKSAVVDKVENLVKKMNKKIKKVEEKDAKAKKKVMKAAAELKKEVAKAKSGKLQTKEEAKAVAKRIKELEKTVTKEAKKVKFGKSVVAAKVTKLVKKTDKKVKKVKKEACKKEVEKKELKRLISKEKEEVKKQEEKNKERKKEVEELQQKQKVDLEVKKMKKEEKKALKTVKSRYKEKMKKEVVQEKKKLKKDLFKVLQAEKKEREKLTRYVGQHGQDKKTIDALKKKLKAQDKKMKKKVKKIEKVIKKKTKKIEKAIKKKTKQLKSAAANSQEKEILQKKLVKAEKKILKIKEQGKSGGPSPALTELFDTARKLHKTGGAGNSKDTTILKQAKKKADSEGSEKQDKKVDEKKKDIMEMVDKAKKKAEDKIKKAEEKATDPKQLKVLMNEDHSIESFYQKMKKQIESTYGGTDKGESKSTADSVKDPPVKKQIESTDGGKTDKGKSKDKADCVKCVKDPPVDPKRPAGYHPQKELKNRLENGWQLRPGQFLKSKNKKCALFMEQGGNLVLRSGNDVVWFKDTKGKRNAHLQLKKGSLTIIHEGKPIWDAPCKQKVYKLELMDSCHLVLFDKDAEPAWSTDPDMKISEKQAVKKESTGGVCQFNEPVFLESDREKNLVDQKGEVRMHDTEEDAARWQIIEGDKAGVAFIRSNRGEHLQAKGDSVKTSMMQHGEESWTLKAVGNKWMLQTEDGRTLQDDAGVVRMQKNEKEWSRWIIRSVGNQERCTSFNGYYLEKDRLRPGSVLKPGQFIQSKNKECAMHMQKNGNLAIFKGEKTLFVTNTIGKDGAYLEVQKDGNVVLKAGGDIVWAADTKGNPVRALILEDDCEMYLYSRSNKKIWASNKKIKVKKYTGEKDKSKDQEDDGPGAKFTKHIKGGEGSCKFGERVYLKSHQDRVLADDKGELSLKDNPTEQAHWHILDSGEDRIFIAGVRQEYLQDAGEGKLALSKTQLGPETWTLTKVGKGKYIIRGRKEQNLVDSDGQISLQKDEKGYGRWTIISAKEGKKCESFKGQEILRDRLRPGQQLGKGNWIESGNKNCALHMQDDGNLALHTLASVTWTSNTGGNEGAVFKVHQDGKVDITKKDGTVLWKAETKQQKVRDAVLEDNCNFVMYNRRNERIWSIHKPELMQPVDSEKSEESENKSDSNKDSSSSKEKTRVMEKLKKKIEEEQEKKSAKRILKREERREKRKESAKRILKREERREKREEDELKKKTKKLEAKIEKDKANIEASPMKGKLGEKMKDISAKANEEVKELKAEEKKKIEELSKKEPTAEVEKDMKKIVKDAKKEEKKILKKESKDLKKAIKKEEKAEVKDANTPGKCAFGEPLVISSDSGRYLQEGSDECKLGDSKETWMLLDAGDDKVFIARSKGKHLQFWKGKLKVSTDQLEWERWTVEPADKDGQFSIVGKDEEALKDDGGKLVLSSKGSNWNIKREDGKVCTRFKGDKEAAQEKKMEKQRTEVKKQIEELKKSTEETSNEELSTVSPHKMRPGTKVNPGEYIQSPEKKCTLRMQKDGNLVLFKEADKSVTWASNTYGKNGAFLQMQKDGKVVLMYEDAAIWSAGNGKVGCVLVLNDDCNAVLFDKDEKSVWSTSSDKLDQTESDLSIRVDVTKDRLNQHERNARALQQSRRNARKREEATRDLKKQEMLKWIGWDGSPESGAKENRIASAAMQQAMKEEMTAEALEMKAESSGKHSDIDAAVRAKVGATKDLDEAKKEAENAAAINSRRLLKFDYDKLFHSMVKDAENGESSLSSESSEDDSIDITDPRAEVGSDEAYVEEEDLFSTRLLSHAKEKI